MVAWGRSSGVNAPRSKPAVYRVNLERGSATPQTVGNSQTNDFLLDENGNVIGRLDIDHQRDRWRVFVYDKGKDRLLLEDVSEMGMPLRMYMTGSYVFNDKIESVATTLTRLSP